MSLHDDLTDVRRRLDELVRAVERLERSVAPARDAPPPPPRPDGPTAVPAQPHRDDLVTIPDTPYDSSLWTAAGPCDDEGLGVRDRRAP
ncbi:hypothetical protein [Streptomyces sp. NPDC050504]|uniref:hypothetical protein n=1 Tax=Streptomyces sp. NPDC050504 TaxID=3365618 RepID=UPI00378D743C